MKTRLLLAALVGASLVLSQSFISADEGDKEFKASCPVSGGPAKETSSVEYKGKKVYFCCNNCPNAFKADKEKYAAKAHHQLLQTGQIVQVGCPMSGREINPDTVIEVAGVKVGFCCNNCKGKAEGSDDAVALVFTKIDKGFTLQTACPLSNKPIDPAKFIEHEGKKVYFCCPGCAAGFQKDPGKYTSKLPQFQSDEG